MKFPEYTREWPIDLYMEAVDDWLRYEQITSEEEKYVAIRPQLPVALYREAIHTKLEEGPNPYTRLKEALIKTFGLDENERVRKLTEKIELGDKKPGDLLREMQDLAATTDDNIVKTLWLQRLPVEFAAGLAPSLALPVDNLRELANKQHVFWSRAVNQVTTEPQTTIVNATPAPMPTPTATTDVMATLANALTELTLTMREVKQIAVDNRAEICAIRERPSRPTTRSRDRSYSHSRARSEATLDSEGRCWYHRHFGADARRCRDGCVFGRRPLERTGP